MSIKETVQTAAVRQALRYLESEPEKICPS